MSAASKLTSDLWDDNAALKKELRHHAIIARLRMAEGGGTVHVGWLCKVCDQEWGKTQPETHRAHCLLANSQ